MTPSPSPKILTPNCEQRLSVTSPTVRCINDSFEKINDSQIISKIVEGRGEDIENAKADLERRKTVLEWLVSKDMKDYLEVIQYINMFYKEPEKLFQMRKCL